MPACAWHVQCSQKVSERWILNLEIGKCKTRSQFFYSPEIILFFKNLIFHSETAYLPYKRGIGIKILKDKSFQGVVQDFQISFLPLDQCVITSDFLRAKLCSDAISRWYIFVLIEIKMLWKNPTSIFSAY